MTNVFGNEAAATLLLFKIEREYWSVLKTFLQYLNVVKEDELLKTVNINKTLLNKFREIIMKLRFNRFINNFYRIIKMLINTF